jgi:dienelactone hydrolase
VVSLPEDVAAASLAQAGYANRLNLRDGGRSYPYRSQPWESPRKDLTMDWDRKSVMRQLLTILVLAATPVAATELPPLRAQVLNADGREVTAWVAGSASADRAVLITHDWFGVSPLYSQLAAAERIAVLRAGVEAMAQPGRKLAVMGFSMGGNVAFGIGSREAESIDATVVVYGGGMEARGDDQLAAFDAPVLMITGDQDAWAMNSMNAVRPRLEAAGLRVDFHVLPGQPHAYMQPLMNGGAAFDQQATDYTLALIDQFLEDALASE